MAAEPSGTLAVLPAAEKMRPFDAIIDFVPDPMYLIDNKLTQGIINVPRSIGKGTLNVLGLRVPSHQSDATSRPLPAPQTSVPSDASRIPPVSARRDEDQVAARQPTAAATDMSARGPEIQPGVVVDFGFGSFCFEEDPRLALPRVILRGARKAIDNTGVCTSCLPQ